MNPKSLMLSGRERTGVTRPEHHGFAGLQREIDRLLEDFGWGRGLLANAALGPDIDVSDIGTEPGISVELPGLEQKDVEVTLDDDILTSKGERKIEKSEAKDRDYRITERSYGGFDRAIELPHGVGPDQVRVEMANGVLKMTLPKPTRSNGRRIEITGGRDAGAGRAPADRNTAQWRSV